MLCFVHLEFCDTLISLAVRIFLLLTSNIRSVPQQPSVPFAFARFFDSSVFFLVSVFFLLLAFFVLGYLVGFFLAAMLATVFFFSATVFRYWP